MKRSVFLGALAAALLAAGAPVASAHDNSQVGYFCGLTSVPNFVNGEGTDQFYLYGAAATPEVGGGTFWCEIRLDGVTQASSVHLPGEGAFVTTGPLRGWKADAASYEVCGHITWDDGHAPFDSCTPSLPIPTDPNGILELINEAVLKPTDALTCTVLAAAAPGVPGVVDIDQTGDTVVLGIPFWDCPPYQEA